MARADTMGDRAHVEHALSVESILVPLDGSAFAERALPVAAQFAARLTVEIHLFSVVRRAEDLSQREALLDAVRLPGHRVHRSVVVSDETAEAIDAALHRLPDALCCMATHGRGRSAALIGSVVTDLLARQRDPLVLFGPMTGELAPWIDPEGARVGIVTCVGDSPALQWLLPAALGWCDLMHEPALLVTVAEPVPPGLDDEPERRRFGPPGDVDDFLRWVAAPLLAQNHDVATRVVWDPVSPASGMRDYLREHPTPLAIAGSHERTGLARVVLGSTAASIVHQSPAPVLVIPGPVTSRGTAS
ncbi:MAG: universal stress protein [Actinobacteria bacterium]|nr:universal stress protein [Actinomycetota bacterium]